VVAPLVGDVPHSAALLGTGSDVLGRSGCPERPRFVDACLEWASDPRLRALPLVGGIDQLIDSADVLSEPDVFPAATALYDAWLGWG
jgi:hypothetical protein